MGLWAVFFLTVWYNLTVSVLAWSRRCHVWRASYPVRALLFAGAVGMVAAFTHLVFGGDRGAASAPHPLAAMPLLAFVGLTFSTYVVALIACLYSRSRRWLLSVPAPLPMNPFEAAEEAVHHREFLRAIHLYGSWVRQRPDDPECRQRLGECYVACGNDDAAVLEFNAALARERRTERRAGLYRVLVDVHSRRRDPEAVRRTLRGAAYEFQGTEREEWFRARLEREPARGRRTGLRG